MAARPHEPTSSREVHESEPRSSKENAKQDRAPLIGASQPTAPFRSTVWDPCLLICQMGAMQAIFYTSLTFCIVLIDCLTGGSRSLDQVFRYQSIYQRELGGSKLVLAYIITSLICALGLWRLVQRCKLCLDFAATVHFWHIAFCRLYNASFCTYVGWWILQAVCVGAATILGEYLCLQTEMKEIPLILFVDRFQLRHLVPNVGKDQSGKK